MLNIRPDIVHQCLLSILDSPLNKKGKLLVYIRTTSNILIEVNPQLSVPRDYKEFSILMINLLVKRKVLAIEENTILMRIIKNNIEKILPVGGKKIGLSINGNYKNLRNLINEVFFNTEYSRVSTKSAITFVIGAVVYGDPVKNCEFID